MSICPIWLGPRRSRRSLLDLLWSGTCLFTVVDALTFLGLGRHSWRNRSGVVAPRSSTETRARRPIGAWLALARLQRKYADRSAWTLEGARDERRRGRRPHDVGRRRPEREKLAAIRVVLVTQCQSYWPVLVPSRQCAGRLVGPARPDHMQICRADGRWRFFGREANAAAQRLPPQHPGPQKLRAETRHCECHQINRSYRRPSRRTAGRCSTRMSC